MERNNKLWFIIAYLFLMAFLAIANASRVLGKTQHGPGPTEPGPFGAKFHPWIHGSDEPGIITESGSSGPKRHGSKDPGQPNPFGETLWTKPRFSGPERIRPISPNYFPWRYPSPYRPGGPRPYVPHQPSIYRPNGHGTGPEEPGSFDTKGHDHNNPKGHGPNNPAWPDPYGQILLSNPNFFGPIGPGLYGPGIGGPWLYGPGYSGWPWFSGYSDLGGRLFPWLRILCPWLLENPSATEGRVSDPAEVEKFMKEILADEWVATNKNP